MQALHVLLGGSSNCQPVQRLVTRPIKARYRNNPLLARICQDALF